MANLPSAEASKEDVTGDELVFSVGERVSCAGERGTVLYVGPVDGSEGNWIGVEWDNPERGKHNGTVKGKRYFITGHPTSGSMVRRRKLTRPVQCVQAVVDRYGVILDTESTVDRQELDALQQELGARFVQVIGLSKLNKKQSKLETLRNVYLRECLIAGDHPPTLGDVCPSIEELDLAGNLLNSWSAVAEIARQLPKLTALNISENRLTGPDPALRPAFSTVKILLCNRQQYHWEDVLECARMWPDVLRLTLVTNRITCLRSPPLELFHNLDSLDLDSNPVQNWAEVLKLAALPRLRDLGLNNTGLQQIEVPRDAAHVFPALTTIGLDANQISQWESVNALSRLPKLCDITFRNNPLSASDRPESIRELVIAKMERLKVLNRTAVTREERRWAELDYLRRFGPDWKRAGGRDPAARDQAWTEFTEAHPRYTELCHEWGPPEDSELKVVSDTICAHMVAVQIRRVPDQASADDLMFERKLPLTMRLSKLKVLVNKLYRGNLKQLVLTYTSPEKPDWQIELDRERDLRFFGIEDGNHLLVRYV